MLNSDGPARGSLRVQAPGVADLRLHPTRVLSRMESRVAGELCLSVHWAGKKDGKVLGWRSDRARGSARKHQRSRSVERQRKRVW